MPHQCVKCGTFYDDGSNAIIKGCNAEIDGSNCTGKLFFYVRKDRVEELQEESEQVLNLTKKDKKQIEKDVYDLIGENADRDKPIVLDLESIRILTPGKYELDLVNLFEKKQPLIYRLDDGKYVVDISETFKKLSGKKS